MIIYSKSSGTNNAAIGKLETPIKMIIQNESDMLAKKGGICQALFNVEKSTKFGETVVGGNEFDLFKATPEGEAAEVDTVSETYHKFIEHIQFMKEFVISAEMMEDANYGVAADAKHRAENFARAYYKTVNNICEKALANATATSANYANAQLDLATADGLPLFHKSHTWGDDTKISLEEAGEREAEECEEYKNARAKYLDARSRITPEEVDPLRKFCLDYSKREWKYRRLCYLSENGLSENDYNDYKQGKTFHGRAGRILRRADRIKAVNLTPSTLLNRSGGVSKSELQSPGREKILSVITSLIPSTVCTLFTVSVILTAKDGLTVESVIEGLLKLSALPIVGFRGMLDGYRFAKESKSAWFETKARLLEAFLAE